MLSSVPLVHEDVHEGAEQENQKRQCPEQMSFMLGPEKKPGSSQKNNQYRLGPRKCGEKMFLTCIFFQGVISHF
jgi:hypothetical protein